MKKWMVLLLPLLAACDQAVPVHHEQSVVVTPPKPRAPLVNYCEGTNAADAIQKIRTQVGEPFKVLKINFDQDSLSLQAQDPKKPENVDEYRWSRGELKGPIPVRLFGQSDQKTLEANLFDPGSVDWTKIPDLIHQADEKVQLEGREFSGVSIDRDMFNERRPVEIDVDYRGTRKSGYLRADRKGKVVLVRVF